MSAGPSSAKSVEPSTNHVGPTPFSADPYESIVLNTEPAAILSAMAV